MNIILKKLFVDMWSMLYLLFDCKKKKFKNMYYLLFDCKFKIKSF